MHRHTKIFVLALGAVAALAGVFVIVEIRRSTHLLLESSKHVHCTLILAHVIADTVEKTGEYPASIDALSTEPTDSGGIEWPRDRDYILSIVRPVPDFDTAAACKVDFVDVEVIRFVKPRQLAITEMGALTGLREECRERLCKR